MDKFKAILIGVITLAAVVAGGLRYYSGAATAQGTTIRVAYIPLVQGLPLFTAEEQGLFEKRGLRVELVRFDSPQTLIDAILSDRVDATATGAATGIAALADTKQPGQLKAYALVCGTNEPSERNDVFVVSRNSTIKSFHDLENKSLGILPGIQFRTIARKILAENNVSPGSVNIVDLAVPLQLLALESGQVDGVLALEPIATIGEEKGITRIAITAPMVKYIADPWCGGMGLVSTKFLQEQPEAARAYIEAMLEATRQIQANQSVRTHLQKYLGVDAQTAKSVPLPLIIPANQANASVLDATQKFVDIFFELNVTQERPNATRLLLRA